jgi:hypothetical protein
VVEVPVVKLPAWGRKLNRGLTPLCYWPIHATYPRPMDTTRSMYQNGRLHSAAHSFLFA